MKQTEEENLISAIRSHWPQAPNSKAQRYIGQFFDRTRIGKKIAAKVEGNYGTYTVSIEIKGTSLLSACSCYIGKEGYCHHCHALGVTFLKDANSFIKLQQKKLQDIHSISDLIPYLTRVKLDSLLKDLKAHGITQKEFAEIIGMNPRHLGAIK